MISTDYRRRRTSFWEFTGRSGLDVKKDRGLDNAATDWSDLEYLCGEGPEVGEKLLAALEKWALVCREQRASQLLRFRHALRPWRKNAPKRSRLPMPEGYMWILVGTLGSAKLAEEALFLLGPHCTYLRPSALYGLMCVDVVAPAPGTRGPHAHLSAPFEVVADLAQQYTNVRGRLAPEALAKDALVSLVWAAGFFGCAAWRLGRRDMTRGS